MAAFVTIALFPHGSLLPMPDRLHTLVDPMLPRLPLLVVAVVLLSVSSLLFATYALLSLLNLLVAIVDVRGPLVEFFGQLWGSR